MQEFKGQKIYKIGDNREVLMMESEWGFYLTVFKLADGKSYQAQRLRVDGAFLPDDSFIPFVAAYLRETEWFEDYNDIYLVEWAVEINKLKNELMEED